MLRGRSFVSFVRLDAFGTYIYRNDDYFERIGGTALVKLCNLHVKQNDMYVKRS